MFNLHKQGLHTHTYLYIYRLSQTFLDACQGYARRMSGQPISLAAGHCTLGGASPPAQYQKGAHTVPDLYTGGRIETHELMDINPSLVGG